MGGNTLATIQQGTIGNPEQINQYKEALSGDLLPRNAQGEVANEAASLGAELKQFVNLYVKNIISDGVQGGFCPAGVMVPYTASETVAPSGWIFAGKTIGAAGSGADHEGEQFRYLFDLYRVVSNYGNTGSEDFDSGDIVNTPNPNGRFIRPLGSVDPDSRTMGSTQASANLSHSHSGTYKVGNISSYGTAGAQSASAAPVSQSVSIGSSGGTESRPENISFPHIIKV